MPNSAFLAIALAAIANPVRGQADPRKPLEVQADLRLRFESDWDSVRADGTPREDRQRLRLRAQLGVQFRPRPGFTLGLRARTGPRDGQQSPHYTFFDFQGNKRASFEGVIDRYFVQFGNDRRNLWVGRNQMPFWTQNELLWDESVTPIGIAGRYTGFGSREITLNAAWLKMLDGAVSPHGTLASGQLVWARPIGSSRLVLAGSFTRLFGEEGARHLRNGNGARDYAIWTANFQFRLPLAGRPLQLGADFMHNSEPYGPDDPDPFTAAHFDQRDAFDASLAWGQLQSENDWLLSYTWARIEALAVNASWAQDDWVRWGSGSQVDGTDLRGHEFRAGWMFLPQFFALARLYLAEAITSVQDGKRFRLDLNYRF